jgi:hypothetical protein
MANRLTSIGGAAHCNAHTHSHGDRADPARKCRDDGGNLQWQRMEGTLKTIPLVLLFTFLLSGCATTIGHWDQSDYDKTDFGAWRTINVCSYRDTGVTQDRVKELTDPLIDLWKVYGVNVNLIDKGTLARNGFWHSTLLNQVDAIPLAAPCDRVYYFVNRNFWDYLYADGPPVVTLGTILATPEVEGEVDDATMTHGWGIAYGDSLNNVIATPSAVTEHEWYHLIGGCPHAWSMDGCYSDIARLKSLSPAATMYPSIGYNTREMFWRRAQVNRTLADFVDPFWPF